jgi:predicted transcriptional regulator
MTGEELRRIRNQLGLTQKEFGDLVGVTWNSIARQERGEIGIREPLARLIRILAEQKTKTKKKKGEEKPWRS